MNSATSKMEKGENCLIYQSISYESSKDDLESKSLKIISLLKRYEFDPDPTIHALCFLSYRKLDGTLKKTKLELEFDQLKIKLLKDNLKAVNLRERIRWDISFFALSIYEWILKEDDYSGFSYKISRLEYLTNLCASYPSCYVSIARIHVLLYMVLMIRNSPMLEKMTTLNLAWDGFRKCMAGYTFRENISKADEIRHIADALQILQILASESNLLNRKIPVRLIPIPKHPKHKPFADCVIKLCKRLKLNYK